MNELTGYRYCMQCGNGQDFVEDYCSRCGKNTADEIVGAVLKDLYNRGGFDSWWSDIDLDSKNEIRANLVLAVQSILEEAASE